MSPVSREAHFNIQKVRNAGRGGWGGVEVLVVTKRYANLGWWVGVRTCSLRNAEKMYLLHFSKNVLFLRM